MMSPIKRFSESMSESDFIMDDDEWQLERRRRMDTAHQLVQRAGEIIDSADQALTELENNHLLGPAIVRGCQDLADAIGTVATQLEQQSDEERRELAQACLQDASCLELTIEGTGGGSNGYNHQDLVARQHSASTEISNLTEDDLMSAIVGAGALLRDVESSLRAVDRHEADEIADVALTLARVFVISLQSFHSSLDPKDLLQEKELKPAPNIELLDDDDDHVNDKENGTHNKKNNSSQKLNEDDDNNKNNKDSSHDNENSKRMDRLRVLWPPLGPAVETALHWGGDMAMNQPLLAVALGLTLWPAAIITTFMGAPLVVVDHFLQNTYDTFQDAPILQNLERGAAQAFHAGRLSLLCAKLIGKQTIRVVSRQVDRHGGIGKITENVAGMALDRITHPIETVGMTWDGIVWGVGAIHDGIKHVTANHDHNINDATPQQYSYEN